VAPTLSARSRLRHHLSALGYRCDCHRFSHSGWTIMPSGPSLCSYKRVCKDDLGSPLQSDGRTFWHGENCGHSSETFLLAKTSTGRQQVYHILHCLCAISKPTIKKQGLYTPLPTPEKPWESISMDYMSGLPSTKQGNDCVFVVVDRFLKMAILTACKKNITVEDTAKIFFE
jgi:hypothetical protein